MPAESRAAALEVTKRALKAPTAEMLGDSPIGEE
jgi:hypothetical protein